MKRHLLSPPPFFIFLILLAFFNSCDRADPKVAENIPFDSTAIKLEIQRVEDSTFIAFFIQEYISGIVKETIDTLKGEEMFSRTVLPTVYDSNGYQLIWKDSTLRQHAIDVLINSEKDGLTPSDYHLNSIESFISESSSDYQEMAALDLLITDAIVLYGYHLLNGKTDVKTLEPTLGREELRPNDEMMLALREHLFKGELDSIIDHLRPNSHYYFGLMKGLQKYEFLADSGAWKGISVSEKKIEPDSSYSSIPDIRKRLIIEGDLLWEMDSLTHDSLINDLMYDSTLVVAVKRFQKRHGLNSDGIIGKGTVSALNITAKEKVDLLKANLERARWIYHGLPKDYILVNIAGYDLRLVRDTSLLWETRVVAGKTTTATPIFKDEMEYIVLNPTWTVPSTISNDEILPKLKSDSTYLERNNMKLLSGSGKSVDAKSIDFSSIKQGSFPYIVRQEPGWGNSLGRVKFIFPNAHAIYLHDTPSRAYFSRERRAFSHGCIRVEDPLKLAEFVLDDQDISRIEIDSIIKTRKTLKRTLTDPLPVYITYMTSFSDDSLVYFFEDVYKRDEDLMKALSIR